MLNPKTLGILFPSRSKAQALGEPSTNLQLALRQQLTALMARPEAQADGIAQFLPLISGLVNGMSDADIRDGREVMRGLVAALDATDETGFTPAKPLPWDVEADATQQPKSPASEARSTDDPCGSDGHW